MFPTTTTAWVIFGTLGILFIWSTRDTNTKSYPIKQRIMSEKELYNKYRSGEDEVYKARVREEEAREIAEFTDQEEE